MTSELETGTILKVVPEKKTGWKKRLRRARTIALIMVLSSMLYTACSSSAPPQTPTLPSMVFKITITQADIVASPIIIYATQYSWSRDGNTLSYVDALTGGNDSYTKADNDRVEIKQIIH